MTSPSKRFLRTAALVAGVWTLVGLITTELAFLAIERSGAAAPFWSLLAGNLVSVWLWAAFTPAMVWMARRYPLGESDWPRAILPHLAGAVALGAADVVIEGAIWSVFTATAPQQEIVTLFLRRLFPNSLCYIAVVAIASVGTYARLSREREATAQRLTQQLTEARLQALQAQLRPHFLFNTLSMIAEQVHTDAATADRMIVRLAHLLSVSLAASDRHEVTLAEELEILQSYLEIMGLRLVGRATYEVKVAPDCLDGAVPTLVLQPLVENAYRHGIEKVTRAGLLTVSARRVGENLEIEVADNGPGFDPERFTEGVGLKIIRERLAELHGAAASFCLRPRIDGGTIAVVRLPYRGIVR